MREALMNNHLNSLQSSVNPEGFPLSLLEQHKKGDYIFKQNDRAFKFYKLKKGIVMMGQTDQNGKTVFSHFVKEGEFFGEEVLLELHQRKNTAQVLSNQAVLEEYSFNPGLSPKLIQNILRDNFVSHFKRVQQTLLRNSVLNLRERLVDVLKEIAGGIGVKLMNGEVLIRTHLKHRELAYLCNASRQSVTTQLIALNDHNYINIDRNSILMNHKILIND